MNKNNLVYRFVRCCYRMTLKPLIAHHDQSLVKKSHTSIQKMKGYYEGQRCFIIGNGPSLTPSDLDKLKKEVCFGANRIYEIFDKTDWRPTYYCAGDINLLRHSKNEINRKITATKYIGLHKARPIPRLKDSVYSYFDDGGLNPSDSNLPYFSDDIADCYGQSYTVTYMCLQLAAYMGFKEIYLLGVDHNYSVMIDPSGNVVRQYGVEDHFSSNYATDTIPTLYKFTYAYIAAKIYGDAHGIKIYNATRGGKLEVFPRVNFDELIESIHSRENNGCSQEVND